MDIPIRSDRKERSVNEVSKSPSILSMKRCVFFDTTRHFPSEKNINLYVHFEKLLTALHAQIL